MIYGIADVGSNTVRLSIYKCEGGEIRLLMNRKVMAGLAGYVRHGALTPEGIEVACQTLQGYRSLMDCPTCGCSPPHPCGISPTRRRRWGR